MASKQEKKKKGILGSFYKSSSSIRTLKSKSNPEATPTIIKTAVDVKPVSNNLSQKTLEDFQDICIKHNVGRRGVERRGGNFVEARRRSVSHVETDSSSVAAFLHVKVLVSDMPGFMQVHAFKCARRTYDSLDNFSARHMAYNIKKEFDKAYGPAWHCIVGSSFGSFVTHATGCFLYFCVEKLYILLFKTKVERALSLS